MFIRCPHCGNNAALRMTGTNGRTYAKCLECGEEILVGVPPGHALAQATEDNRRDKAPAAFRTLKDLGQLSRPNYHPYKITIRTNK